MGRVDAIIEGDNCDFGIESTVVDVTKENPVILRPGSITFEMIREVIPNAEILIEKEIKYEKEKNQKIELKEKTGNVVNKVEIYINNFKINLSKQFLA